MNNTHSFLKQMFCLQLRLNSQIGKLEINDRGLYSVNNHILSEGEIISIFHKGQFLETSIHFASQIIYSAIGLPIDVGQLIKYESED